MVAVTPGRRRGWWSAGHACSSEYWKASSSGTLRPAPVPPLRSSIGSLASVRLSEMALQFQLLVMADVALAASHETRSVQSLGIEGLVM
jgi:hypothetical protein